MFEKEAEEYAEEHAFRVPYDGSNKFYDDVDFKASKEGYLAGAEFGYNKANEWHKPSEKLPEECTLVLAYLFEETEPTLCKYIVSNQWECLPKRIVFCSNEQVRKWKEIVLPKELAE